MRCLLGARDDPRVGTLRVLGTLVPHATAWWRVTRRPSWLRVWSLNVWKKKKRTIALHCACACVGCAVWPPSYSRPDESKVSIAHRRRASRVHASCTLLLVALGKEGIGWSVRAVRLFLFFTHCLLFYLCFGKGGSHPFPCLGFLSWRSTFWLNGGFENARRTEMVFCGLHKSGTLPSTMLHQRRDARGKTGSVGGDWGIGINKVPYAQAGRKKASARMIDHEITSAIEVLLVTEFAALQLVPIGGERRGITVDIISTHLTR